MSARLSNYFSIIERADAETAMLEWKRKVVTWLRMRTTKQLVIGGNIVSMFNSTMSFT